MKDRVIQEAHRLYCHYPTMYCLPVPPVPQVIDWMKDPVSAKEYAKKRTKQGCEPPTDMWFPSGQYCEAVQCVNGEVFCLIAAL